MTHFDRRFTEELKEIRANCDEIHITSLIKEGKGHKLEATATLAWVKNGRYGNLSALYEYHDQSLAQKKQVGIALRIDMTKNEYFFKKNNKLGLR